MTKQDQTPLSEAMARLGKSCVELFSPSSQFVKLKDALQQQLMSITSSLAGLAEQMAETICKAFATSAIAERQLSKMVGSGMEKAASNEPDFTDEYLLFFLSCFNQMAKQYPDEFIPESDAGLLAEQIYQAALSEGIAIWKTEGNEGSCGDG